MKFRYWITGGIIAFAIAILAWATYKYGTRYCIELKAVNALKEPKDRALIDCSEFWINRYQAAWSAILTVAGAIGAALIAWRAVAGQIERQDTANTVALIDVERRHIADLELENEQLKAVQKFLLACKNIRETDWDGHGRPFLHMVERLRSEGRFPFPRIGPSRHAVVNMVDDLLSVAARLDEQRLALRPPANWDELVGSQFNQMLNSEQVVKRAKSAVENEILDRQNRLRGLEEWLRS